MGYVESYGALIGTRLWTAFQSKDGSTWTEIDPGSTPERLPATVGALSPFGDAVLLAGRGYVAQHEPSWGYCPLIPTHPAIVINELSVLSDAAVAGGRIEQSDPAAPQRNLVSLLKFRGAP